jgi:tRNA-2-methylthio-N6-dimethylallyladenosine synthase
MNEYDSEFIAERLIAEGYAPVEDPADADVLLVNTCSVRDGAEDRVRGRLGNLAPLKARRPGVMIGVVGCMAQRLGGKLRERSPQVDLIAGTDSYRDLPRLIDTFRGVPDSPVVETTPDAEHTYAVKGAARPQSSVCAHLTIQQGCDKFCTFCIVPYTRGRERSKAWREVVDEARRQVDLGVRRITLLGQNVNSYRDGEVDFAELLRRLDAVEGLARIRFTSSYPRDMTDDVLRAVAECPSVCEYLHFPVQSGSDTVLRRMKRRHSAEWYLRQVDRAREWIPDVQFVTDLIVGFPGETDEDFQETLDLVKRVRFSEAYMYRYSPREGTPATRLPDDLPEEVKAARLTELIELQRGIGEEILQENLGREMEVLVEGPSRRDREEPMGRTRNGFMVVLPRGSGRAGDLVTARLTGLSGATYRGIPVGTGA